METERLRELTHENTREFTGDTFQIRFQDGPPIDLTLEEVEVLVEKHVNPRMERDMFAMRFRGPREPLLAQGVYAFHHDKMGGPLPIFIVPLSTADIGALYEAVFT
jgi:hypothetical protein